MAKILVSIVSDQTLPNVELIKEFQENANDTRKEIWALFMFEMWYDKWIK